MKDNDGRILIHDPSGKSPDGKIYAINMRWSVKNKHGIEIYRGPEWRARMIFEGDSLSFGEAWRMS